MQLWRSKLKAFGIHLTLSLIVAALAAVVVFGIWYPYPYRDISGGRDLFVLIVTVDVILGPLITFTAYNPAKSRRERLLDFSVIGLVQLAALLYGLWTVFEARPVHTVFEHDRFRVVHALDVPAESLPKAQVGIQRLPLTGPTWLSLRAIEQKEREDFLMAELSGVPLSAQPALWQPYEAGRAAILKAAKPLSELKTRHPAQSADIDAAASAIGQPLDALVYLPLQARKETVWTAILDRQSARPLAYLPIDSF